VLRNVASDGRPEAWIRKAGTHWKPGDRDIMHVLDLLQVKHRTELALYPPHLGHHPEPQPTKAGYGTTSVPRLRHADGPSDGIPSYRISPVV
jgi:hypothetical protein